MPSLTTVTTHTPAGARTHPQFVERVRIRRRSTANSAPFPNLGRSPTRDSFGSDVWEEQDIAGPKVAIKKDEPMSPVTVVLYVVFFYVVWQILTRSDDNEILSHLPSGSQLNHQAFERNPSPQQQPPYHLPYTLPQIPSPIPSTNAEATATWRIVIGTIVYPIYIAITLIAIPMPFLISGLNLILSVVNTILYPVTSTLRLLARTFILAPLNVVRSFLLALYPVYVFVGGVVGAGALLGVAFGWAGRLLTNLLIRPQHSRRRKSKRSKSLRGSRERSSSRVEVEPTYTTSRSRPVSGVFDVPVRKRSISTSFPPHSRAMSGSYERRYLPIVDVVEIDDDLLEFENVHATGREGAVVGVRRRGGVRYDYDS